MASIKQSAKEFIPTTIATVDELASIDINLDMEERSFIDKTGKEFTIQVITVNKTAYRMPLSVIKQVKELLAEKPNMKTFKVKKQGMGMNTSYFVMPLE